MPWIDVDDYQTITGSNRNIENSAISEPTLDLPAVNRGSLDRHLTTLYCRVYIELAVPDSRHLLEC